MRLSSENTRTRWIALCTVWLVIAVLLALHTRAVGDRLAAVGQRGLRGEPSAPTPYKLAHLPSTIDAQVWVRYARSLLDGHDVRLRHTNIDNAPDGREVHWNSAWAWTIAGAGWLQQRMTGEPLGESLERATLWLPPAVLFVIIVLVSSYAGRIAGAVAGVALAIGMIGHENFYDRFFPDYADHHGLLSASALGLILGAIFMGAGWWRENASAVRLYPSSRAAARRAAIVSAISGALGVWVSAASAIPPIALIGIAAIVTVLVTGRAAARSGLQYDASVWRLWGRVGAISCFALYLVEYFPFHLGLRLEVNHPLYALAWWGAGELIAEITGRWMGARESRWSNPLRLAGPLALLALVPLVMLIGGSTVFTPMDSFLARLHHELVAEFMPLSFEGLRWNPYLSVVGIENVPLIAGIGLLAARGRRVPSIVWFATIATLAFTVMGWMQYRWLANASGPQMCLALVLVAYVVRERRSVVRTTAMLATFGVLFAPTALIRVVSARDEARSPFIDRKDVITVLYRDVAAALRASQPSGTITLLTDPNASLSVGFYGDFQTLGTIFWENLAGLRSAGDIFAAQSADEAAALVRSHKVTHVAMISEEGWSAQYFQLLRPDATRQEFTRSFGYQLLVDRNVPPWLQVIPYRPPDDLSTVGVDVFLYKVAFDQTPAEALYHAALGEVAREELPEAVRDFGLVIARDPKAYRAWIGKGGALFSQRDWDAAAGAALTGIGLAPPSERRGLRDWLASSFLREHQGAQAARVFRTILADAFDPGTACSLAFVLSTTSDDRARNGAEAMALARRALATHPDSPVYLSCLGAALAETGRYADAAATEEHALEHAREQRDADTETIAQQVLDAARAGRAFRE